MNQTSTQNNTAFPGPLDRRAFHYFEMITLRYADNDANAHVNNAHYYAFFDTAVEGFLRSNQVRDELTSGFKTPVVASGCRYFREIAYPGSIELGVRIAQVGRTSITFEIAIFSGAEQRAAAQGTFTLVCVSKDTHTPAPVPQAIRSLMRCD
jgi:acyl-CoA thioester hydrolase